MNTVDYIYWLSFKSGWTISDEIYLLMDDKNIEDTFIEFREAGTGKLIDREIDSVESVLEWLENNKMIVSSNYVSKKDYYTAKQNGISKEAVYNRMNLHGWTKDDAITKPIKQMIRILEPQVIEIAKKNGVNRRALYQRIKLGWDLERATTEPVRPRNHK
jgi:hypothetical protein